MSKLVNDTHSSGWNILVILSCLGLIVMFDETTTELGIEAGGSSGNGSNDRTIDIKGTLALAAAIITFLAPS